MWLSTSGNAFRENLGHILNILFHYNFFFMSARINTRVMRWDYADKSLTACIKEITLLDVKHSYWTGNDGAVMSVMDLTCSLHSFYVVQPCQMVYQVCHESVERLIQYGILLVAEVKWQRYCGSHYCTIGGLCSLVVRHVLSTCCYWKLLTMCPGLRLLHFSFRKCQTVEYSHSVMLHDCV